LTVICADERSGLLGHLPAEVDAQLGQWQKRGRSMSPRRVPGYLKIGFLSLFLTLLPLLALGAERVPWTGPVPKADCGPWDWTESGLQGQTTPWERESGDSEGGYNCNLELVGQFQGEGEIAGGTGVHRSLRLL
jgi:hypothetical protein